MAETQAGSPMVSIRGVHKKYGDLHVLRGVDLDIMPGQVVCIIGPSGSGKTTMLRCINFLEPFEAGTVQRVIYANSATGGATALDLEPDGPAAREVDAIKDELEVFAR